MGRVLFFVGSKTRMTIKNVVPVRTFLVFTSKLVEPQAMHLGDNSPAILA